MFIAVVGVDGRLRGGGGSVGSSSPTYGLRCFALHFDILRSAPSIRTELIRLSGSGRCEVHAAGPLASGRASARAPTCGYPRKRNLKPAKRAAGMRDTCCILSEGGRPGVARRRVSPAVARALGRCVSSWTRLFTHCCLEWFAPVCSAARAFQRPASE